MVRFHTKILLTAPQTADMHGVLHDISKIPTDLRGIAMCVSARIQLLVLGRIRDDTLLATDIPIFLQSCMDPYLRRLAFELLLLGRTTDPDSRSEGFLVILRDRTAPNRRETHARLVKEATAGLSPLYFLCGTDLIDAYSGGDHTVAVTHFGFRTLLHGLTHGSSELRIQYAELFATLSANGKSHHTSLCGLSNWYFQQNSGAS